MNYTIEPLEPTDTIHSLCLPSDIENYGWALKYARNFLEIYGATLKELDSRDDAEKAVLLKKVKETEYDLHELFEAVCFSDLASKGVLTPVEGRKKCRAITNSFKPLLLEEQNLSVDAVKDLRQGEKI